MPNQRYRENAPSVTSDYADGEVVILNLESGAYYGLDSTGAEIWTMLLEGQPASLLRDSFAHLPSEYPGQAGDAFDRFLADLLEEKLLVPRLDAVEADPFTAIPAFEHKELPVLNKYTDMNELLLIDPVHEVDDRGWPNQEGFPDDSTRPVL